MTEPVDSLFDAETMVGRDPRFFGGAYADLDLDDAVGYGPSGRMTQAQMRELHGPSGPGAGRDMVGGARRKSRKSRKARRRSRSRLRRSCKRSSRRVN